MKKAQHRNVSFATVAGLREIVRRGEVLSGRGGETREIRNQVTVLAQPLERCLFVPHRGNSVIASIAETLWVLAGRNDVEWLEMYLHRAREFSDDGLTWRGGYGPRLRDWNGVDQLDQVRRTLIADQSGRRAVMSLFDPSRDFVDSKDIPCNNWLHWLVRDNRLHLNVAVRSNDLWWGFSGVNSFEWSVLQEAMAKWVGVPVGELTFFASSLHLYQKHYDKAASAMRAFRGSLCYDYSVPSAAWTTPWETFPQSLVKWFECEERARSAGQAEVQPPPLTDPFLLTSWHLLRTRLGVRAGWNAHRVRSELAALPENDLAAAGYEYFGREMPEVLDDIPHPRIAAFMADFKRAGLEGEPMPVERIKKGVCQLHKKKDAAYQNAWKRRGELGSTLPNIARKVDRLEVIARTDTALADESTMDTAVDLFVYLTKYRLLLLDAVPESSAARRLPNGAGPVSDHVVNVEALVAEMPTEESDDEGSTAVMMKISQDFDRLQSLAEAKGDTAERLNAASALAHLAWRLILRLAREQPGRLEFFGSIQ